MKPLFDFPLSRGKPRARCKPCHVADAADWATKNKDKAHKNKTAWRIKNMPPKFYGPPLPPEIQKQRRDASRKKWAEANPEADAAAKKRWADANKHVGIETVRRRQAKKRNATPLWADVQAMQEIYRKARELSASGVPHEVDHIIPITHPLVCGLHCEANLQVLPMSANRRKSNKIDVSAE